jgi:hypothetical protein
MSLHRWLVLVCYQQGYEHVGIEDDRSPRVAEVSSGLSHQSHRICRR